MRVISIIATVVIVGYLCVDNAKALSPFNGVRQKTSSHNLYQRFVTSAAAPRLRDATTAGERAGLETVYQWKFLDFQYPDLPTRHAALENG